MPLGALLALPIVPFPSIVQHMGTIGLSRRQRPQLDQVHRLVTRKGNCPVEKIHQRGGVDPCIMFVQRERTQAEPLRPLSHPVHVSGPLFCKPAPLRGTGLQLGGGRDFVGGEAS